MPAPAAAHATAHCPVPSTLGPHLRGRALVLLRLQRGGLRLRLRRAQLRLQRRLLLPHLRLHLRGQLPLERYLCHLLPRLRGNHNCVYWNLTCSGYRV